MMYYVLVVMYNMAGGLYYTYSIIYIYIDIYIDIYIYIFTMYIYVMGYLYL